MDVRLSNREVQRLTVFPSDQGFVLEGLRAALRNREHDARVLYIRYQCDDTQIRSFRTEVCANNILRIEHMRGPLTIQRNEARITYEELWYGLGQLAQAEHCEIDLHDAFRRINFIN